MPRLPSATSRVPMLPWARSWLPMLPSRMTCVVTASRAILAPVTDRLRRSVERTEPSTSACVPTESERIFEALTARSAS